MNQNLSVWVYTSGSIDSISKESRAVVLAEMFPNRIYFFAELVPPTMTRNENINEDRDLRP